MDERPDGKYVYRSSDRSSSKDDRSSKVVYRKPDRSSDEELEDIDVESNFMAMVKELLETQASIAKVDAQIAIRDGQDHMKAAIDSVRDKLETQAKRFGTNIRNAESQYAKNSEKRKSIMEQYEDCLDGIDDFYSKALQEILDEKASLEAEEQAIMTEQKEVRIDKKYAKRDYQKREAVLRSEVKDALDSGDFELAQQKMEELKKYSVKNDYTDLRDYNAALQVKRSELRQMIEQCEKEYEKCINERNEKIDKALDTRDTSLALIPKQNIFQKMVGSIFNRFNGTKKFVKSYMDPLQAKLTDLKNNKLPQIRETVAQIREQFADSIAQSRVRMERTVADKVADYSSRLAEFQLNAVQSAVDLGYAISDTAREALMGAKETRDQLIENAKNAGRSAVEGALLVGATIAYGAEKAKDTVVENTTRAGKTILTVGGNIVKGVKDNVELGVSKGKQTYRSVVQKGYEAKLGFIDGVQAKLAAKREELNMKMEKLNPDRDSREDKEGIEESGPDMDD